jgi:hypothetical protein
MTLEAYQNRTVIYCPECGEDFDVDRDSPEWLAHVAQHAERALLALGNPGPCPLCSARPATMHCLLCDEERCWDCFAGHDYEVHGRSLA